MPLLEDLQAARARRTQMIAELTACECEYPLRKNWVHGWNMSGHHDDCPADAIYRAANGLPARPRKDSPR